MKVKPFNSPVSRYLDTVESARGRARMNEHFSGIDLATCKPHATALLAGFTSMPPFSYLPHFNFVG